MAVLKIENISKSIKKKRILSGISFELSKGERLAMIGPNGAGKSTLLNLLTGTLIPSAGSIRIGDRNITQLSAAERVPLGVARTLQRSSIFPKLSCYENILAATQHAHSKLRFTSSARDAAHEFLERVGLTSHSNEIAHNISHGEKRLLEIGMAFATEPEILLLDEPMAGLDEADRFAIQRLLDELSSVSILIVEHDMRAVFEVADRIGVLANGRLIALGTPAEIRENQQVHEIYLGAGGGIAQD